MTVDLFEIGTNQDVTPKRTRGRILSGRVIYIYIYISIFSADEIK